MESFIDQEDENETRGWNETGNKSRVGGSLQYEPGNKFKRTIWHTAKWS